MSHRFAFDLAVRAHVVSGFVLVALMIADYASGGALSTWLLRVPPGVPLANRDATAALYLELFAWPLTAWLRDAGATRLAALPPAIALAIALLFSHVAVAIAVAAGALVFAVACWRPRATGIALAGLCAGYVLLSPVVAHLLTPGPWMHPVPTAVQFSVYHRAKVWSFASERIAERPVFGWGIDASRRIPGGDAVVDANRDLGYGWERFKTRAIAMPLHPHSAALQVWLELGGIGALLLALLCGALPLACLRASLSRTAMAAGLAGVVTAYLLAMTSFSLWQSRWHIMLWLAAVSAIVLLGGGSGASTRRDQSPPAARAA